jgi:hypothetical protein
MRESSGFLFRARSVNALIRRRSATSSWNSTESVDLAHPASNGFPVSSRACCASPVDSRIGRGRFEVFRVTNRQLLPAIRWQNTWDVEITQFVEQVGTAQPMSHPAARQSQRM